MAKQKFTKWLPGKKNIMKLDEKASMYVIEKSFTNTRVSTTFKAGAKWMFNEMKEYIEANPAMSAKQILEHLKTEVF